MIFNNASWIQLVHLNIVGIWSKIDGFMFDEDVGNSAHLLRSNDGMIPLRHGTRGLLYNTIK